MSDIATEIILFLALAAFAAGFIDSIAGGGGLIAIPALLLAGFPPAETLGTNKLQGLFGTGSAALHYASKGQLDVKRQLPWAALAFAASGAGALVATSIPGDALRLALPFVLVAIALYFALKPDMDDADRAQRVTPMLFGLSVVPLVGFYDGVFGPGTGSFLMLAFVSLAGYGVLKATVHTKFLNFATNLGGFAAFAAAGVVSWKVGLIMGAAQFLGARIGSGLAIRNGARLIKPLLVLTCVALAVRLLVDPAHPLRVLLGV
ncbi:TSUP family transporter [Mesorhizobium sp. KR9-304]|uniref:TSUP family transporter n=1 Tax=Mesorhizobium sp. KR9-304 TaxID=3156614 RepID=UPI0032B39E61